ncbi:energy transducer TonB [Marinobacter sp. 71-i]|uniref:Energy transducer TonB n=1 Tax=Marinobacter iranensis TaxID=2962607 RepID=A0ABT5YE26_9GAMM|nr:energy transducer TonB [Marinobacter iranensis]MDF0751913.1 energy transducer TonB [Marinobacter iranensis]
MLEYGTATGLPGTYRITLAISVALLLHTLVMAALPFTMPDTQSHRQTVRVSLISPGSEPSPEATTSTTGESSQPNTDRTATESAQSPPASRPDIVATESSRRNTRSRAQEQAPTTTPAPQTTAMESPAQTTPSREASATAAGSPEPPAREKPEAVTRVTQSPRDVDPYMASLAIHIGKELDKRPVPSSRSVTEPVTSQLELKLLPSGALTSARVTRSTGFSEIDQAVYQAALLASPYPKPPEKYSGRKRFRIELIFAPERL